MPGNQGGSQQGGGGGRGDQNFEREHPRKEKSGEFKEKDTGRGGGTSGGSHSGDRENR